MSTLIDFYLSDQINPIIMILCYWAFWPGLMFVVAAIFESRKVYLGKGQSHMFFPGDFMLGIGIVCLIGICAHNQTEWNFIYSTPYWLITAGIHILIAIAIRTPDVKRYPKGSRNSPTKIAHDFCGYFVSCWLMAAIGLPQLYLAIKTADFKNCMTEWVMFSMSTLFFIAMTIWDITHPATKEDLLLMHPDKYWPIWKK